MRNLTHRLARLEHHLTPQRPRKVVLRFVGPGSESFPQPTQEDLETSSVVTIRLVEGNDGGPVDPMQAEHVGQPQIGADPSR